MTTSPAGGVANMSTPGRTWGEAFGLGAAPSTEDVHVRVMPG